MANAKDEERAEYQRQYDEQIAKDWERIRYCRDLADTRNGLRGSLAASVADRLEHNRYMKLEGSKIEMEKNIEEVTMRREKYPGQA